MFSPVSQYLDHVTLALSECCLCRSHEEGESDQNMSLLRDQSLLISGGGVGGFLADHKFSWETEEGAIVSNEIQKGHSRELTTNGGGGRGGEVR